MRVGQARGQTCVAAEHRQPPAAAPAQERRHRHATHGGSEELGPARHNEEGVLNKNPTGDDANGLDVNRQSKDIPSDTTCHPGP